MKAFVTGAAGFIGSHLSERLIEAGATVVDQDGTTHTTDSAATIATSPGIRDELIALLAVALNSEQRGA